MRTKRLSATLALDKIKKIHEWEGCSESSAMFKNNDPVTDKTPIINMGLGVNAESMSLRKEFYSNAVTHNWAARFLKIYFTITA